MIRRPPRSTLDRSSAASDVYKRQEYMGNLLGSCITSISLTTLVCCISLRREISLMAVLGTPSSSFSSLIFFTATIYRWEGRLLLG
eukprot:TRINITY_DN1574_c0_g1_i9.p1 TRINITY_DN1574_c0_g1~~TRINITY_DN1574_c0_g1_i9.p1  ORF type:complete len:101 (-),score=26.14 TRINITY_DN1574_c0_g1_i9:235-492(-)